MKKKTHVKGMAELEKRRHAVRADGVHAEALETITRTRSSRKIGAAREEVQTA